MRSVKCWILILLMIVMIWPYASISNSSFIEVPKGKFEVIADLSPFKSTDINCPNYIRWNFIQLKENSKGLALVREVEGFKCSCFLLEIYNIKKKEIVRDMFLGTSEELTEKGSSITAISDIVVDNENIMYVGLKDKILVLSNELHLLNILTPNLKSYDIDFANILFVKENKLFILWFGKIISVDKKTGEIIDYININKTGYPGIVNLGTHGIADYTESSIVIYYADYIFRKEKELKKALLIYNVNAQSVEKKFIFSKDERLFSDEISTCFHVDSCYPYIAIWLEDSDYNTYVFIINPESEWKNLLKLGKFYTPKTNRGRLRKEENKYYYYLQIHDYSTKRDTILRINLTDYLE